MLFKEIARTAERCRLNDGIFSKTAAATPIYIKFGDIKKHLNKSSNKMHKIYCQTDAKMLFLNYLTKTTITKCFLRY